MPLPSHWTQKSGASAQRDKKCSIHPELGQNHAKSSLWTSLSNCSLIIERLSNCRYEKHTVSLGTYSVNSVQLHHVIQHMATSVAILLCNWLTTIHHVKRGAKADLVSGTENLGSSFVQKFRTFPFCVHCNIGPLRPELEKDDGPIGKEGSERSVIDPCIVGIPSSSFRIC